MRCQLFSFLLFFSSYVSFSQNIDIDLLKKINGSYNSNGGKVFSVVTHSVNPVCLGVPGGMLITGLILKDKPTIINSIEVGSASFFTGLFTAGLKWGIDRDRPFVTYPNDVTKYTSAGSPSFPSGHTSMAFSTATSVSLLYPKWYVIVPAYTYACAVGYSRMYLGVHYPSDVLAGAILGSGTAIGTHYLFRYLKKRYVAKKQMAFL
jgi:membrane-associated phospholipid phosphatase